LASAYMEVQKKKLREIYDLRKEELKEAKKLKEDLDREKNFKLNSKI